MKLLFFYTKNYKQINTPTINQQLYQQFNLNKQINKLTTNITHIVQLNFNILKSNPLINSYPMPSTQSQSSFIFLLKTPWTSRTYLLSLLIFHALDIFYDNWSYIHLTSNFFKTILQYQAWRILTSFLYEPNTIIVVLVFLQLLYYLPKLERQNGTVITFYQVISIGFLVHIFTLCYEAIIYFLNDMQYIENWPVTYNIGAGGLFVNIIIKFLWFNFKQPNKYLTLRALFVYLYPLAFTILATYLCNQTRIDMIAAYIIAFIQVTLFRGGIIFYTADTYTKKQYIVKLLRLNRIPLCFYHDVNHDKIKVNNYLVVEAHQFYILKNYVSAVSNQELNQVEMQTERGSFQRNNMISDDLSYQSKGEKWEQTEQIAEDQ